MELAAGRWMETEQWMDLLLGWFGFWRLRSQFPQIQTSLQIFPPDTKDKAFERKTGSQSKLISKSENMNYLSDVPCGTDEALELSVGYFMNVHVERVHVHRPLWALAICSDARLVCSHQKLSSRNPRHLWAALKCHLDWETSEIKETQWKWWWKCFLCDVFLKPHSNEKGIFNI